MLENRGVWLRQWFKEVRQWRPKDVDPKRLTWLKLYGVHCHVWNFTFFEFISKQIGTYICSDDDTMEKSKLDVARTLILSSCFVEHKMIVVIIEVTCTTS